MTFPEVKLQPGQQLIDESGRPRQTHPFAYWPDYFVVNREGDTLIRHEYHQLPSSERKHWYKIRYAIVVDRKGDVVRREYRDGSHEFWSADTRGHEVNRQDPASWPDFIGVNIANDDEISAMEYWSLPVAQRANYRIVRFCVVTDVFGPVERVYADQEAPQSQPQPQASAWEPDDSCVRPYYEPALVSTSPLDTTPESAAGNPPRESRTPLADQIKDEYKLHAHIRACPTDYPQSATGTT